jgi:uncharacterized protein DUF4280
MASAKQVVNGAPMTCSFGASPASLIVLPEGRVNVGSQPAATIMDFVPTENIPPFGMCSTLSNPQVASATTAAQGVLTPQPCIPVTTSPWVPAGAPTVMVGGQPALDNNCTCMCAWGGVIKFTAPGQLTTNIP